MQVEDSLNNGPLQSVVPIKESGTKPPLFLIHSNSLDVNLFKPLGDFFNEDQPFYGVQAIGISDDRVTPPSTIEEIASSYKKEIERINNTGQYYLAGYSDGGLIAYEISKQLLEENKDVRFLGVVDTNAVQFLQPKSKLAYFAKKIARQFLKIPFLLKQFVAYPRDSFDYQIMAFKRRFADKPANETITQGPYELRQRELRNIYNHAVDSYRLKPLNIAVSVFSVKKRLYYVDEPRHLGWNKLALNGFKVYKIPGDHKTFQDPPNNKKFVELLQRAIRLQNSLQLNNGRCNVITDIIS